MNAARRGIATDEMKAVARDEDVTLEWLIPKIANGSIIIPHNNARLQKIQSSWNRKRHEDKSKCKHWKFHIKPKS